MSKTVSGGMATHLAAEVTTLALLWRIVRTDGEEFHFTTHDEDIQYPVGSPSNTYKATQGFNQSAFGNAAGMNVDDVEVTSFFDDESITAEELRAGLFDGASVYISVVNYADLSLGHVALRRGWLGECIATPEGIFKAELRGFAELLQSPYGQVYQPMCRADLGDSRCGVDLTAYTATGTIVAAADRKTFSAEIPGVFAIGIESPQPADYWVGGLLTWTSGPNSGRSMEVVSVGAGSPDYVGSPTGVEVEVYLPVGYTPQAGDTFELVPGCDKTAATCAARYANILNFRGEPYLPGLDAMLTYPDAK